MRALLAVCTTILLIGACGNGITPSPQEIEWTTSIQGAPGWEHLSGGATVIWTVGAQQFTTAMEIAGDQPGAVRPWHVHHNTCGTGGGIVGLDGHYPRLNIGPNGSAAVVTTVPVGLSATAPYHVNVHLSGAQMEIIIACGDLTIGGNPTQNPSGADGPGY